MPDFYGIDDKTKQVIADRVDAANNLSGDFDQDAAKGLIQSYEPSEAVKFAPPGIDQAIANKYGKLVTDQVKQIKDLQRLNYPQEISRRIGQAGDLANKAYRINFSNEMALRQRQQAEEGQRAAILGSLLGLGGAIAGGALGGAGGAAIGGQAGQAGGQMMKSNGGM